MDGPKDSREKAIVLGILVPMAIVLLVVWNLRNHEVYFPIDRPRTTHLGELHRSGLLMVYRDAWIVWGTVVLKIGCATALSSIFGMGNWERFEDWADAALRCSMGVFVCGILLVVYGFLR